MCRGRTPLDFRSSVLGPLSDLDFGLRIFSRSWIVSPGSIDNLPADAQRIQPSIPKRMKRTIPSSSVTALRVFVLVAATVWVQAPAWGGSPAREHVREMLHNADQQLLLAQYQELRMSIFHHEIDLDTARIKMQFTANPEQKAQIDKEAAMTHEGVRLLHNRLEEIRRQLLEQSDQSQLQGKWAGKEWVSKEQPSSDAVQLAVEGERAEVRIPSRDEWFRGTIKLGEARGQPSLAFHIEESSVPDTVGQTVNALFKLEGNQLVLAANKPGMPEPPEQLEPSGATRLFVFERQ